MKLLTLDIGNTQIKAGLFHKHQLVNNYAFSEINQLNSILNYNDVTDIAISSVVPMKTQEVIQKLGKNVSCKPFVINKDTKFNLHIEYESPDTLGMDRICSSEGAFTLCNKYLSDGTYLITIDFGTATTVNIVQAPNRFIGGLIAPGVKTMFKSLNKQTAQLPELSVENYNSFIGKETNSSIFSGVVNSSVGLVEKVFNYIYELDNRTKVIAYATGGLARTLLKYLPADIVYDEFLVLKGIDTIYALNKG